MQPGGDSLSAATARVGLFREGARAPAGGTLLLPRAGVVVAVLALACGIGALIAFEPFLGLAAAAGLALFWALVRNREAGIVAVFFLVPLGPLLWLTPDGIVSVQKALIGTLVAIWLARVLLARDRTIFADFTRSRLNVWGLLFLAVFLVALPWCREIDLAYGLMARWASHLVLLYFLVFTVRSFRLFRRCLTALVVAGALVSTIAIVENVTETSVLEATGRDVQLIKGESTGKVVSVRERTLREGARVAWARSMATFKGPNELGLFIVFVSGLALYFLFRPASRWLMRLLAAAALVLGLLALDFTGSRGALSGFLVMAGIFVFLWRFPFKWFLFAAGGMALLVLLLLPGESGTQWRGGLTWDMIRHDERVQWIEMSTAMFADHPVAGIGLGQFEPRYYEYRVDGMPKRPFPPHNIFCQFAAENGSLGLLLLFFMIYAVVRELFRVRNRPVEDDHRLLGNALLAVFAGMMAFSLTSNVLLDETFWTFIAVVAIVSTLHSRARDEAMEEPEKDEEDFLVVIMPAADRRRPS